MNFLQQKAADVATSGHNLVLTGQAGTGKSYTLGVLHTLLKRDGKRVQLTCTTGIACTHFPDSFKAMTLHRWAGLGDGRYAASHLCKLLLTDERFMAALKRIRESDVLIVDEISMLSAKLLDDLEYVLSEVRGDASLFGGMQVIVSGDFRQLPPVANQFYMDDGSYCFKSKAWKVAFPHHVNLVSVLRTTEMDLVNTVNDLAAGKPSRTTITYVDSLARPTESSPTALKLFATNVEVDLFNHEILESKPGEGMLYKATDDGRQDLLRKCISAPKKVWLKIGCPVILLINLLDKLVNGSHGTVVKLDMDGPTIHFSLVDMTQKLKIHTFSGKVYILIFVELIF